MEIVQISLQWTPFIVDGAKKEIVTIVADTRQKKQAKFNVINDIYFVSLDHWHAAINVKSYQDNAEHSAVQCISIKDRNSILYPSYFPI